MTTTTTPVRYGMTVPFAGPLHAQADRFRARLRRAYGAEGRRLGWAARGGRTESEDVRLRRAAIVGFLVLLWMVPPTVLASAGARALAQVETAGPLVVWSGAATLAGFALWVRLYARFEVPLGYALLFPFGSAVAAFIVLRSWVRGERRIEWKGRRYVSGKGTG